MQKIIIFGYSGMGRFVQYSLDTKQYQVVAFLDNCEKIWNGENKIPILSPEKVKELEYDFIVISLAEYEEEMKRQLISYGVSEEKIITFMRLDLKWQEPRYAMMRNCMSTIIERNIWVVPVKHTLIRDSEGQVVKRAKLPVETVLVLMYEL